MEWGWKDWTAVILTVVVLLIFFVAPVIEGWVTARQIKAGKRPKPSYWDMR